MNEEYFYSGVVRNFDLSIIAYFQGVKETTKPSKDFFEELMLERLSEYGLEKLSQYGEDRNSIVHFYAFNKI